MDKKDVMKKIKDAIKARPNEFQSYQDYFDMIRALAHEDYEDNKRPTFQYNLWLRKEILTQLKKGLPAETTIKMYDLLKKTYFYMAQDDFESFMYALEWNRKPEERFYQPRAKTMHQLTVAIQELIDDELDELFLSMPPRVGKSTFLMFLMCFLIGKDPEKSNLYSAFSDIITTAFYNGILEVITDPVTYCWQEIFPNAKIVSTNAKDETLNIDRKKRYPSLTARSLYGTLNGACDCNGFLISDDLIGGIEEALNKDRLVSAWSKVDNNLIPRAKECAKLLWCGTRWSVGDPAGLRMTALESDSRFASRRYKIISLPALNEKGESNFDYPYGVGFSTEYYLMRQASFDKNNDIASWNAQYMQMPVERSGVLFEPSDMRYFNGELPPEEEIVRKFIAVDPAFGGGDFTAAPICYEDINGNVFVVDVMYSNADKRVTQPELVNKIKKWGIKSAQFECTRMTSAYKEKVEEMLRADGYKCNVIYKPAPTQGNGVKKEVRIYYSAPDIRENFVFLETKYRDKMYNAFMQNVFQFAINGNNKHDDAPDSLAMAVDMLNSGVANVKILKRVI